MDLLIGWSLLFVLGILSYISLNIYKRGKPSNLPPGSTGWPIIGESLQFLSAGMSGKPESFIRSRMIKYSSNVFKTSIAGSKMAVLCGANGNKMVFSNENMFGFWWPSTISKILAPNGSAITEEGKLRDSLSQFLKPEAISNYVPIMDKMMREFFVKEIDAKNTNEEMIIRMFPFIKKLAFSLSCKIFMNIEDAALINKLDTHFSMVMEGLFAAPIYFPGTNYYRAIKAANHIQEELYPIIKQRISDLQAAQISKSDTDHNKYDLLSFLASDALITMNEDIGTETTALKFIADVILSVLVASHETTSSIMCFVVYFLADHPHVYNQVLEEQVEIKKGKETGELLNWNDLNKMKYSRRVMSEVMRLAPPAPGAFRQANQDFTYAGFTVPKGWKIFWSVHSTNKNPTYFENPEEFNPSRFEGTGPIHHAFVPFGVGPRMCPGNEFARAEILIFIHNMVTRFRWEKVVKNEKIIYITSPFPAHGLPVRLLANDNYST